MLSAYEVEGIRIIIKHENSDKTIPLDSFVKVLYPLNKFFSVIKIPETALYNEKYVFVIIFVIFINNLLKRILSLLYFKVEFFIKKREKR